MQLSVQKNKLDKVSKTKTIRIKIVIVKCNCKFSIQNQIFKLKKKRKRSYQPDQIPPSQIRELLSDRGKGLGLGVPVEVINKKNVKIHKQINKKNRMDFEPRLILNAGGF